MASVVLGIAAAIGASTFYSLGIALQALDAKETPHDEHLRLALARGLLRRRRWLLGTALSILGFPLQLLALLLWGRPARGGGVLLRMVLGRRMLGAHAGRYEHLSMAAIVVGVIGAG